MNQFQFGIQSTGVVNALLFHRETSFHEVIFGFSKIRNDSRKACNLVSPQATPIFFGDPFKPQMFEAVIQLKSGSAK